MVLWVMNYVQVEHLKSRRTGQHHPPTAAAAAAKAPTSFSSYGQIQRLLACLFVSLLFCFPLPPFLYSLSYSELHASPSVTLPPPPGE